LLRSRWELFGGTGGFFGSLAAVFPIYWENNPASIMVPANHFAPCWEAEGKLVTVHK